MSELLFSLMNREPLVGHPSYSVMTNKRLKFFFEAVRVKLEF